jgi:hypothetical protein
MLDTEMHIGFEDAELRNGIGFGLANNYLPITDTYKLPYPSNDATDIERILYRISLKNLEIERIKLDVKREENILAFYTVMQFKGWKEFDVSEVVTKTGTHFVSFIGTEEEYKTLLERIHEA